MDSRYRKYLHGALPTINPCLANFYRGCSQQERLVLIGYYIEDLTMKEVAASLGLSESRVSQVHTA